MALKRCEAQWKLRGSTGVVLKRFRRLAKVSNDDNIPRKMRKLQVPKQVQASDDPQSLTFWQAFARNFCQCSGLCACLTALACAVAASVFIYIAGDGAGNGPKPIVSWNLRGRLRVGTGNQASVNVVSRFFNFWCDLEDTISRIETLPEGACSFFDCRFQSHKHTV